MNSHTPPTACTTKPTSPESGCRGLHPHMLRHTFVCGMRRHRQRARRIAGRIAIRSAVVGEIMSHLHQNPLGDTLRMVSTGSTVLSTDDLRGRARRVKSGDGSGARQRRSRYRTVDPSQVRYQAALHPESHPTYRDPVPWDGWKLTPRQGFPRPIVLPADQASSPVT
jgi:hypothetical protein